ncbi:MAG: hypothetical protein AAB967_02010, partial [Patescibacteria group bacterium]
MEDLIFAGTAKRPRLGQAQAGLYFENHGNFFPVDFREVSVVRQVNRDGMSQYFLNKSEIRLKDLVDFFAKARLGTKGLVVITQGNSDLFISAPPTVRREMIEEMLGLREYQIKRTDAERRLKSAEVNLEKVKALLEEILPHLRSLKRQTNRWEKRTEIQEPLRVLEDEFFGSQFGKMRRAIVEAEREIVGERNAFIALEKEKEKTLLRLKEVEASHPKERQELAHVREAIRGLSEERSNFQKGIGRLEAQIELSRQAGRSPVSAEKAMHFVHTIKEKLENSLEEEFVELREVIADLIREIDAMLEETPEGAPHGASRGDFQEELQKISNAFAKAEKEIQALREKEKALEKNQEHFYAAFKSAVSAVQGAKDGVERWEHENQERLFKKERLLLQYGELEKQAVQAGRRASEFSAHHSGKEFSDAELGDMERRMFKHRGDLASIGEIDEALLAEVRATQERYEFLDRESKDLEKAR